MLIIVVTSWFMSWEFDASIYGVYFLVHVCKTQFCLCAKNIEYFPFAGAFDRLVVETPDGNFPLIQLAQIVQKNPQLVIINMASMPQVFLWMLLEEHLGSDLRSIQYQGNVVTVSTLKPFCYCFFWWGGE